MIYQRGGMHGTMTFRHERGVYGMAFCDNLRALMGARGVSRRKMASGCGISPSAVNPWFRFFEFGLFMSRREYKMTRWTADRTENRKPPDSRRRDKGDICSRQRYGVRAGPTRADSQRRHVRPMRRAAKDDGDAHAPRTRQPKPFGPIGRMLAMRQGHAAHRRRTSRIPHMQNIWMHDRKHETRHGGTAGGGSHTG